MRIGIDVDDTITNSYKAIIKEVSEYYHIDYNNLLDKKMGYDEFLNNENFPNYTVFAFERYRHIMEKVEIKEDAVRFINKLHDEGNEIIFITARHHGEYDDPYAITFKYLSKHEIKFDKIITNRLDKDRVCLEEGIDLFIDDSISNCKKVKDAEINVLLFDAPFNQNTNDFKRVYSWQEVYNIVNEK